MEEVLLAVVQEVPVDRGCCREEPEGPTPGDVPASDRDRDSPAW